MDAEIAAMMADLGVERRDAISTVDEKSKQSVVDTQNVKEQQLQVKAAVSGNERLSAWHGKFS